MKIYYFELRNERHQDPDPSSEIFPSDSARELLIRSVA